MINFNVPDDSLVPNWANIVDDVKPDRAVPRQKGRKLFECREVDLQTTFDDINRFDFIPIRLVVVRRFGSAVRMTLVFVRRDCVEKNDQRMPIINEIEAHSLVERHFWDIRLYRNPGAMGGNFIIESANPLRAIHGDSAMGILCVDDETKEFELLTS